MPVSFISRNQRESYGCFDGVPSPDDLDRYFHLDEFDLGLISKKRGQSSRRSCSKSVELALNRKTKLKAINEQSNHNLMHQNGFGDV